MITSTLTNIHQAEVVTKQLRIDGPDFLLQIGKITYDIRLEGESTNLVVLTSIRTQIALESERIRHFLNDAVKILRCREEIKLASSLIERQREEY